VGSSSSCGPISGTCGKSWRMIPQSPSICLRTIIMAIDSRTGPWRAKAGFILDPQRDWVMRYGSVRQRGSL
jgi:hypothetical protein